MDCSPPGSSIHGMLRAGILEWVDILQGIFPTRGPNTGLLYCKQILYPLSHKRNAGNQTASRRGQCLLGAEHPSSEPLAWGKEKGHGAWRDCRPRRCVWSSRMSGWGCSWPAFLIWLLLQTLRDVREEGARGLREKDPRGWAGRSRKAPSDPRSPVHRLVVSALPAEMRPHKEQRPGQQISRDTCCCSLVGISRLGTRQLPVSRALAEETTHSDVR